jgi:hypothetical protein
VSQVVQGLHSVAEEVFGEALPAVIGVGEKFCNESGSGSVTSEGSLYSDDGGGDAAICVRRQQGSWGIGVPWAPLKTALILSAAFCVSGWDGPSA